MTSDSQRARPSRLKRVLLAAAITVVAINVWTGGPLLAVWVGSQAQSGGPPTMTAIFVVVITLALVSLTLVWALARLSRAYERMTGQEPTVRQHTPWLRSMSAERPQYGDVKPTLSTPERILVGMVVVVFVAFEVWFFFFSTSPIDNRSGRSAAPVAPALVEKPGVSLRADRRQEGRRSGSPDSAGALGLVRAVLAVDRRALSPVGARGQIF